MSQFAEAYELGIFAQIVRLFEGAIAENGKLLATMDIRAHPISFSKRP
jgi:hypothetical protein